MEKEDIEVFSTIIQTGMINCDKIPRTIIIDRTTLENTKGIRVMIHLRAIKNIEAHDLQEEKMIELTKRNKEAIEKIMSDHQVIKDDMDDMSKSIDTKKKMGEFTKRE